MSVSILARPLVGPSSVTTPLSALEQVDLVLGVPADALAAVAELRHQRPERGEALVEVGIVALDHGDRRHGLAGDRLALALLPVLDVERPARSRPACRAWIGVSTTSFSTPSTSGATSENFFAIALVDLPVAPAPPTPGPPPPSAGG